MLINTQNHCAKLANKEPLSESKILDLLKTCQKMLDLAAHLAICHETAARIDQAIEVTQAEKAGAKAKKVALS